MTKTMIAWLRPTYVGRRNKIDGWLLTITDTCGNGVLSDQEFASQDDAEKRLECWLKLNPTTTVVRKLRFCENNT
jgi:hypothetical protein